MESLIFFLSIFSIYYALRLYKQYNFRKHQLELYQLRDKIRQYAIEGKIKKNDWSFTYLDTSICKSVHSFGKINIIYAVYLMKVHKTDTKFEEFKRHLDIALNKNNNLKELHDEYAMIIGKYVFTRHIVFLIFAAIGLNSLLKYISFLRKVKMTVTYSVRNLTAFPETSTSYDNYNFKQLAFVHRH